MKIEKIKPVPKYILARIRKRMKTDTHCGKTMYYAYLTKNDGELAKVTVAVRVSKKFVYKQCAIHGLHSKKCFVKDMAFSYLAGYRVGWFAEGVTKTQKWYEDGKWEYADNKYFDVYAPVVNLDYVLSMPKYRYSAVDLYGTTRVLQYLKLYEQFPQTEHLVKAGLRTYATSVQILKLVGKDKHFAKWLMRNRQQLANGNYYIDVILRAYKTGKPLQILQEEKRLRLKFAHDENYQKLFQEGFPTFQKNRLISYLATNNIRVASYRDYFRACRFLELDMNQDKNIFPRDFANWHDIRIDEYHTKQAELDEKKRADLYANFATIAQKYSSLEYDKNAIYVALIAGSPQDLVNEGEALHHCVGRMGYDQKFARGETLIFFIRMKEKPEIPFVTVEYSPTTHKILQIHGDHNCHPDEATLHYINKIWLPRANKKVKLIAA